MFGVGLAALFMGVRVSSTAHREAAKAIIAAPVSFFDTTPLGRIMSRCGAAPGMVADLRRFTKDLDTLDNNLNDSARMAINTLGSVVGSIVLIAIVQQYFLIAVFVLLFGYYVCRRCASHADRAGREQVLPLERARDEAAGQSPPLSALRPLQRVVDRPRLDSRVRRVQTLHRGQ